VEVEIACSGDAPRCIGLHQVAGAVLDRVTGADHAAVHGPYCQRAAGVAPEHIGATIAREVANPGDAPGSVRPNGETVERELAAAGNRTASVHIPGGEHAVVVAPQDVADAVVVEVGLRSQAHHLPAHAERIRIARKDAEIAPGKERSHAADADARVVLVTADRLADDERTAHCDAVAVETLCPD